MDDFKNHEFTVLHDNKTLDLSVLDVALEAANRAVVTATDEQLHGLSKDAYQYLAYDVVVQYLTNVGTRVAPAATIGQRGKLLRLFAPTSRKTVRFAVVRHGNYPILPDPEPTTDYEFLISSDVSPASNTVNEHGVRIFVVSGMYVYETTREYDRESGDLAYPRTPFSGYTRFPIKTLSFTPHYGAYTIDGVESATSTSERGPSNTLA